MNVWIVTLSLAYEGIVSLTVCASPEAARRTAIEECSSLTPISEWEENPNRWDTDTHTVRIQKKEVVQ